MTTPGRRPFIALAALTVTLAAPPVDAAVSICAKRVEKATVKALETTQKAFSKCIASYRRGQATLAKAVDTTPGSNSKLLRALDEASQGENRAHQHFANISVVGAFPAANPGQPLGDTVTERTSSCR